MPITISGSTGIAGVDGSAGTPAVQGTDTNTGIFFPAADTIAFGEGGSEAMRLDTSGNVGIGISTNESGFKLHVVGNAFVQNTSGQTTGKVVVDSADNRLVLGSYFEAGVGQYSFISSTDNAETGNIPLLFRTGTTERMRIDSSGNVGIGTSSPQAKLVASNAGAAGLEFFVNYPGGGVGTYIQSYNRSGSAYVSTAYDAADHAFRTSGTERMRIDSSGNLLFNSGYGSVATAYGCRAWVNFNGTGTVAIRASGNVSSITDFATGDYQVNITNAMPDANYAFQVAAQRNSAGANIAVAAGQGSSLYQTASTFRVLTYNSAFVSEDPQAVLCAVFR
jgi:hypothetical protein